MNLPPLPDKVQITKHIPSGYAILGYTADQMHKYAEAAVVAERERIALAWVETVEGQAKEIERLKQKLRYQDGRDGRIGTHSPDCWSYGPAHYDCALRRIKLITDDWK